MTTATATGDAPIEDPPPSLKEAFAEMESREPPKWVLRIAAIGLLVALFLVGMGTVLVWQYTNRWDPLGVYDPQLVQNTVPAVRTGDPTIYGQAASGPALYWNQQVTVTGVKCVKPDAGIVNVTGVLSWVSDQPPGQLIEVSRGGGPRGPGCVSKTYSNDIPAAALATMKRLAAQGIKTSTWHLTGIETPVDEEGRKGEIRVWVSVQFTVIHENAPA